MSKFLISGVWKNSNKVITHVLLHEITEERTDGSFSFASGLKTSVRDAIEKCRKNYIHTLVWHYPDWVKGAEVIIVNPSTNFEYLRSNPDNTKKDNLDNLINMQGIA